MCFICDLIKKYFQKESSTNILINFSDDFFVPFERGQVQNVILAQHAALKNMHNNLEPYGYPVVVYNPEVYGATLSNGIQLGDAIRADKNDGHLCWNVMAHEQGHNFFGGTSQFYYNMVNRTTFLQEALAVLSAIYTYKWFRTNPNINITNETRLSVYHMMEKEIAYQKSQAELYKLKNKPFNLYDVVPSQALDYFMIEFFDKHGWDKCKILTKCFQNRALIVDDQCTYICVVLSQIQDVRQDFLNLNFPVDEGKFKYYQNVL